MRETGIGTSLLLIAMGAVLAFAVHVSSTAIDLNAIGGILIVVGILGLLVSFVVLGEYSFWSTGRTRTDYVDDLTPPHEHRQVTTKDVVYEDREGPRVERVREVRR